MIWRLWPRPEVPSIEQQRRRATDGAAPLNTADTGRPADANPIASVGILMLDTAFERGPGDIGHPESWPFPVRYRTVAGASARRVVYQTDDGLLPAFIEAGRALVAEGARLITTSCGFLALHQRALADALAVPVASSALLQLPWVQSLLPAGQRVAVITASRPALTARHLAAAGVPPDTPIAGFDPGSHFHRVIVDGEGGRLERPRVRQELLELARRLQGEHPAIGALVLECTNLPPWSDDLQQLTGLPVHDIRSLVIWLHAALRPTRF